MSFKRGDTFSYAGAAGVFDAEAGAAVQDFTGWQATWAMRTAGDELVAEGEVIWLSRAPGIIKLYMADTNGWPVGVHVVDIRFVTPSGEVKNSPTQTFAVGKAVARGAEG